MTTVGFSFLIKKVLMHTSGVCVLWVHERKRERERKKERKIIAFSFATVVTKTML